MKIYDEITREELTSPDLEVGYLYDGSIVTGHTESHYEVMEGTVTDSRPNGLRYLVPAQDIVESCQYYHTYTEEEVQEKREAKLTEISDACNAAIVAGADVTLSDESTKHFAYSIEDQSNVSEMFNAVLMGAAAYPYHADNEMCMMYSAADIVKIYATLSVLKTSMTTYHNMLKNYILTLEKVPDIEAVTYGQTLTGEFLSTYETLMASAQEEMQKVLAKVPQYASIG